MAHGLLDFWPKTTKKRTSQKSILGGTEMDSEEFDCIQMSSAAQHWEIPVQNQKKLVIQLS